MQRDEQLVGIEEIQRMTGLPKSWLYAQTAAGRLPSYKLGKYNRYLPSEVRAWLEAHRRGDGQNRGEK